MKVWTLHAVVLNFRADVMPREAFPEQFEAESMPMYDLANKHWTVPFV
jgi:hypothetical protein